MKNYIQQKNKFAKKLVVKKYWFIALFLLCPITGFAAQTGMNAWEDILNKISESLTGPVAYAIAIIAIVLSGMVMAFADLQGGAKKFVQACCGLSISFFAVQIATQFLGFSGAVI